MARKLSPDQVRARVAAIVESLPEGKAAPVSGHTGEQFTLYLGARFGAPLSTAAVSAIVVWIFSVYVASWMEHRAYRGPAETLLRRLTYRAPIPGTRQLSRS